MLKPKAKGLFIDISEFSIFAARTSGFKLPIKVEQVADFPISGDCRPEDVRAFLESLIDFKGNKYYIARCGVYPKDRFIHHHEVESLAKIKRQDSLQKLLVSEYNIELGSNSVSILNANDGADFNSTGNTSKQMVFCGAPVTSLQETQDQVLSYGLYPERLELSSVTTLGGLCDYTRFIGFESSVIYIELASESIFVSILNKGSVVMTRMLSFGLNSIFPVLQQELELKDEASARKLFYTNTFNFAEMGKRLLLPILKELQSISGYYEVHTGLTIDNVFIGVLPNTLNWVSRTISESLGFEAIQPDMEPWLKSLQVEFSGDTELSNLESGWLGVFSLMGEFNLRDTTTG